MSSFPSRALEVWRSSLAYTVAPPITGAFAFELFNTPMVPQTLQFLAEVAQHDARERTGIVGDVLAGMRYFNPQTTNLLLARQYPHADDLMAVDATALSDAIRQLELHLDINLTFSRVSFLADVGMGPSLPLLVFARMPFARGVAFEVGERGEARESLNHGDFVLSDKARIAHQHYSTGMALLAGEDMIAGLIDAAFLQFYLAIEAVLETHEKARALEAGKRLFGGDFDDDLRAITDHVYTARHRFFGHAHPKYLHGLLDTDTAFAIAKQMLVGRWCARRLIGLLLNRPVVKRELRLYPAPGRSVAFNGTETELLSEFKLPD